MYSAKAGYITIAVTIAERIHLFSYRTQKLSSLTPKVLRGYPRGRIGSCRIQKEKHPKNRVLFVFNRICSETSREFYWDTYRKFYSDSFCQLCLDTCHQLCSHILAVYFVQAVVNNHVLKFVINFVQISAVSFVWILVINFVYIPTVNSNQYLSYILFRYLP